jgi:hypothetical protein
MTNRPTTALAGAAAAGEIVVAVEGVDRRVRYPPAVDAD